jgi:hypothetical protein
MEMYIKKTIGKNIYNFVVKGDNLHSMIMESQKLSFNDVKECGWCNSKNLILNARVTPEDGYEYTEVKCLCCKAALVFGRMKKEPNTFYLRKNEDNNYDWKQSQEANYVPKTKHSKSIV